MLKNNVYMKSYLNIIKEDISVEKCQQIAKEIGGEYIPETNTIDCKGNKVYFKNSWLDENGTFDFKLINTSNDWFRMFWDCDKLTHLPDSFTIPDHVESCECMFYRCRSLTHLPDNFTIPDSVTNCSNMFHNCVSLNGLPENLTISKNVVNCEHMFEGCESLTDLPDNFCIPVEVPYHNGIFDDCNKLKHINPEHYIMVEV